MAIINVQKGNINNGDVNMQRSKMTDKQRDEIVALRQTKAKWTEIQKKIGVDRRTAKREYENWERKQSAEGLQSVRKEVASDEFRAHMKSIIQLAVSLVSNLNVPLSIYDIKNSEEFFIWFWSQDVLQINSSRNFQSDVSSSAYGRNFNIRDTRIDLDEKKLLYKSLRSHTGKDVWNILDNDWKNATDKCAEKVLQLQSEAGKLASNYFKDAIPPGFLEKFKKSTLEKDPVEELTKVMVNGIWRFIMQNMKQAPLFVTAPYNNQIPMISLKFCDRTSALLFTFNGPDGKYLAKIMEKQCNSAFRILTEQTKTVHELRVEVDNIKKASDTLRDKLNPLKLYPMILQTRCDLCPV